MKLIGKNYNCIYYYPAPTSSFKYTKAMNNSFQINLSCDDYIATDSEIPAIMSSIADIIEPLTWTQDDIVLENRAIDPSSHSP